MYKVYVWTNQIDGKRYVGTTGTSIAKRAGLDGYLYRGATRFYQAIQETGFDNFKCEILADNLTKRDAAILEKHYIQEFGTMQPDKGYNQQAGGYPVSIPRSNTERIHKISNTLKEQRSSEEYRAVMSDRMQAVWDDPERRASMLAKRAKGKKGGKKPIPIFCEETGITYPDMATAAKALGIHKSVISSVFSAKGTDVITIGKRLGTPYTLHRTSVYVKEGELLEASAGDAGGNQQPSFEQGEFPF